MSATCLKGAENLDPDPVLLRIRSRYYFLLKRSGKFRSESGLSFRILSVIIFCLNSRIRIQSIDVSVNSDPGIGFGSFRYLLSNLRILIECGSGIVTFSNVGHYLSLFE